MRFWYLIGGAYLIVGAFLMRALVLSVLEDREPGAPEFRVPVWPFAILGAVLGVPLWLCSWLQSRKEEITGSWKVRR